MINGLVYAAQAVTGNYVGIPYSKLDCQAFVQRVLRDCGENHNWRGSNHMWRSGLSWRGTIADCIRLYGAIPRGAWLFTIKHDGGEIPRGYHDSDGNAAHVGIYVGGGNVLHSTTGGVQWDRATSKRWTHVGFCRYIDTNNTVCPCCGQVIRGDGNNDL